MNIKIFELGLQDLNACMDLDQKSLKGIWSKSQWERELNDSERICIGAKDIGNKKLFGLCTAWIVIDELHITSIAVLPNHQRKGLGRLLLSELIKRSKSLQTNQIFLEVKDTNKPAKALYKSMGFKLIGNRPNYYQDRSVALTFVRELTNT